jgi:hypothetical protein
MRFFMWPRGLLYIWLRLVTVTANEHSTRADHKP